MAEMEDPEDDNVEGMSPPSVKDNKLQLPMSCDPPGPTNPLKQLVWIVSEKHLLLLTRCNFISRHSFLENRCLGVFQAIHIFCLCSYI